MNCLQARQRVKQMLEFCDNTNRKFGKRKRKTFKFQMSGVCKFVGFTLFYVELIKKWINEFKRPEVEIWCVEHAINTSEKRKCL